MPERSLIIAFGIFIAGVSYQSNFSNNPSSSSSRVANHDPPAESLAVILFVSSILLLITSFLSPVTFGELLPSESHDENASLPKAGPVPSGPSGRQLWLGMARSRDVWILFVFALAVISARIELHGYLVRHAQCSTLEDITLIPFIISLYEYWSSRHAKNNGTFRPGNIMRRLYGTLAPSLLLIIAGNSIRSLRNGWESTIICPIVTNERRLVFWLQILRALIDSIILITAETLARSSIRHSNGAFWRVTTIWGFLLLGSTMFWAIGKAGAYIFPVKNKALPFTNFPPINFRDLVGQSVAMSVVLISAAQCIGNVKALTLSFAISIMTARETIITALWATLSRPYPSLSISTGLLAILFLHAAVGLLLLRLAATSADSKPSRFAVLALACLLIGSIFHSFSWTVFQERTISHHPVNILMTNARQEHAQWLADAKHSTNLQEAVNEYKKRYGLLPPPGFDKWYEYATNRSSRIIDNYDQIYRDLLPFRAFDPSTLRHFTSSMTSNQWNDIAAVMIRDGVAGLQPEILPTHRWMIEGIVQMIAPFAKHLPDMDIGFNLNDECRVSVPWDTIQLLNFTAQHRLTLLGDKMHSTWSPGRSLSWALSRSNDQQKETHFTEHSKRETFRSIASKSCHPASKARKDQWHHDTLCLECFGPHSREQFLQDWELSGDICHQPDLANLHGFFISPSALKVSTKLLPVFSQSKVSGFNDILYPSPWNYLDKAKYNPSLEHPDPDYDQKEATAFWRGTTSEGFGERGSWKGMARQRFMHMANNNTNHVAVLLPSSKEGSFTYNTITPSIISQSLGINMSIGIAEDVARCNEPDCAIQKRELGITTRVPFDDHWKYRFLYDSDGAGFSGRFLPFLQSNSLPFRTALFRQWFDTRLTPWLHFVPQDIRFHDMWSTLAYFAGAKSVDEDGKVTGILMHPHDREGKIIAREGKKWAEETLRKEDMEIYLFRLLLEWGRLTDDRRDDLGFSG